MCIRDRFRAVVKQIYGKANEINECNIKNNTFESGLTLTSVSYTHLDVYKRQDLIQDSSPRSENNICRNHEVTDRIYCCIKLNILHKLIFS